MRLTKFLGRKCKVCMRILLLKSLFLGTNSPSFLPILCGILFVFVVDLFCRGCLCVYSVESFLFFAVDSFCFAVESFLFLPWIPFVLPWNLFCFCRGFLLFLLWIPLCIFLLSFCFSLFSLVPSIISHEIRKTWEIFWKKSIVFWKKSIVFWG